MTTSNPMKLIRLLLLTLPLLLVGCCSNCCHYATAGAEEFVIDSYKIREGKFSILEMEGICSEPLWPWLLEEYPDTVCDGDILEIALYHPSRMDLIEAVSSIGGNVGYEVVNGSVRLPDAPPIPIAGLPLEEARQRIEEEYLKQIHDVEIFARYRDRRIRKIELIGMVRTPSLPADGKLRLYEALSLAGVPDSANFFKSYLIRDGRPLPVDMNRLIRYGDMSQNVVLRGGDRIYIASPAESRMMIMGEVGMPQTLPLPQGYISLREAIVSAGGIPYTGNKSCIQVIRGNILCPKIYSLNWHCIVHLPNDSLLLMPGDTVYVTTKPITDWNRFISQLLPSFAGVQTVYTTSTMVGGVFIP